MYKKYDIVKFHGINNFLETGIIKNVIIWDNDNILYELQTIDKKSLIYFGQYDILEKVNQDNTFDFSDELFHNLKLNSNLTLNFTTNFVHDYTEFYENNFLLGYNEQLKDFTNIYKLQLNNLYVLRLDGYAGRYSYICTLNNISNFIIHEELLKNHVKEQYN